MRIARISTEHGPRHVVQDADEWLEIADPFADTLTFTGPRHLTPTATLLAPVLPTVVIGMSHNCSASDRALPPQGFLKSARTVIGPNEPIRLDPHVQQPQIETELAVVLRKQVRNLAAAQVPDAILGYTIGNDVTAMDQIPLDHLVTQAKNGDGFTPLGPWIETDLDPYSASMTARVNGQNVATGDTSHLAWNLAEILVYLTKYLTLGPGDVVLTGCPATWAPIQSGDVGTACIEGFGELTNPIR